VRIQAHQVHLQLPGCASIDEDPPPVRRGARVPVVTAIIGALGVIIAAAIAGAFTIWPG
jgi:hypothetical protein